ncbi:MAG: transposase family protein [Clostridiales bacterium]|nr:transposase family protein [Clostridiales bacterium]
MRRNTSDKTIERNYLQKWRFLIEEYELTKLKKHPRFRFVGDFYKHHGTNRQTFLKYYHRYRKTDLEIDLLPRRRGAKWKSRRPLRFIEEQVLRERRKGLNRYEIHRLLKPKLKKYTPSPSGIYNILKRYGYNRLSPKMKEKKRQIIKKRAGELGHIDCHYLSKDIIINNKQRYYLVGLVDDCSRLVWVELLEDIKSLTVMFGVLRCMNALGQSYQISFEEVLTDNGSEFASPKNKEQHPFERMLLEMGIKHRYTRPYRPQTNGKIERFWRTLEEDVIEGTTFDSVDHLQKELEEYLFYYNEYRPHQGLGGRNPKEFLDQLPLKTKK